MSHTFTKVSKTSRRTGAEPHISNSAVYDTEEERRPLAVNKRQVRPKPIPIDKASLALELLNNQTRPTVNIVGTRHFHEDTTPLDKNYPIEIELQRIAMSAVPDKPAFQPLKTKSPFTEEMIEKYREEERRGIRQRGYDVPPELEVMDFEEPREYKLFHANNMVKTKEARARLLRNRYASLVKDVEDINQDPNIDETRKQRLLEKLAKGMKNIASEMSGLEQELLEMLEVQKTFKAEEERIKRANAQKIKNAEDQLRLLNTTLPIQQMKGEPDEVYRDRLIALRVPVDNSRVDATEARIYEHKLFKRNLKKLIDLPLYQVENIIKTLDDNDSDRTYQLNEIFPKVETEFIKQFGRKPLLRNPVQSLTEFFINLLEAPLQAQEQSEAITSLAEQQSVSSGEIDPSLRNLKKAEVLKLLKDAGLTKKRASEFQKMTVNKLKVIYTEHLKKTRGESYQAQVAEQQMMGDEDTASRVEQVSYNKRKKEQLDRAIMRLLTEEKRQLQEDLKEEKEYEKIMKKQEKQQQKQERGMMGAEEKPSRMIRKQRNEEEEYLRLIKAQRKQAQAQAQAEAEAKPSKQQTLTKFMSAKKK